MTAWPGSKTIEVDGEGTHTDLNTYVRDALDNLYKSPCCLVSRSTTQSIPGADVTALVTWTVEDEDVYGFHAASATTLVVPAGLAGLYVITCALELATSANGSYCYASVQINGTYDIANDAQSFPSSVPTSLNIGTVWPLAVGDTVSVLMAHDSATAKNLLSTTYAPRLGLVMVGP